MEYFWIYLWRIVGTLIGLSPFVRNFMFHIGMTDDRYPLTFSDGIFIVLGFIFVWGSGSFGTWANELGKSAIDKIKRK